MGSADFRVGGRIFATLASQKQGYGNLMLTPDVQAQFVAEAPDVFVPIAGGWGKSGATHVRLAKANEDLLTGALRTAWKIRAQKNTPARRGKRALIVVIAAGLSLGARPATACQCVSVDAAACAQAPTTGDLIAVGTVLSKELIRSAPLLPEPGFSNRQTARPAGAPRIPPPIVRVTLSVSESFRGNPGETVVVQTDTSDCAYPFEVGHAYLVVAEEIQGTLRVNKCTRTRPAKMAVTTIQQLRARRDGSGLPDLYGFAGTHPADSSEFGWDQIEPAPGLTVTAEANGKPYRTQTANDGSYAFRGLPAGYYHLSIEAPPGRVALPTQTGVSAGPATCPMSFEIYYDGRISGTVNRPDGQLVLGSVTALYAGPEKINAAPAVSLIKNGSFEIPRLAPGQYRLMFFAGGGRPLYYPGTPTASEATLIELSDGTHVDDIQFRVF